MLKYRQRNELRHITGYATEWALLEPESAIAPAENAIRIESPAGQPQKPLPKPKPRRTSTVSETDTSQNGHAPGNGRAKAKGQTRRGASPKSGSQNIGGLIQQAEAVRTSLRDSLAKTTELIKGLRRQRRLSRSVESTLASLRQLKTLGG